MGGYYIYWDYRFLCYTKPNWDKGWYDVCFKKTKTTTDVKKILHTKSFYFISDAYSYFLNKYLTVKNCKNFTKYINYNLMENPTGKLEFVTKLIEENYTIADVRKQKIENIL